MLDGDGIIGVVSRGIRLATASQCETRDRGRSSALTRTHAVSVCLSVCLSLPYPNCTGPSCPVCRECWAVLQPDKLEVKRALRMASEVVDLDIRDMSAKS
jgi:hypothetical protein